MLLDPHELVEELDAYDGEPELSMVAAQIAGCRAAADAADFLPNQAQVGIFAVELQPVNFAIRPRRSMHTP